MQSQPGTTPIPAATRTVDEIAELALGYLSGAAVAGLVYLGDQLGLYRALRDAGPMSGAQLADKTGLSQRWVVEWLHGQASAGLVQYTPDGLFELSAAQSAVLAEEENPAFASGGFALIMPLLSRWDRLFEAFRTGHGAPYEALGEGHAIGERRFSQPWMQATLVPTILPSLAGVTEKLRLGGRAADIGCGSGAALVEMARAFPASSFHGYDSSETSLRLAARRIEEADVKNVELHHVAAEKIVAEERFDFVLTWDCMHDMTDPAGATHAIRNAIEPDGTWLIVDINGMPTPEENYGQPLAPLLYGFSVLDCLGCSTSAEGGAALGTLGFTEQVAREMTRRAGFTRFSVHDFGNPLNSFFEVRQ